MKDKIEQNSGCRSRAYGKRSGVGQLMIRQLGDIRRDPSRDIARQHAFAANRQPGDEPRGYRAVRYELTQRSFEKLARVPDDENK